MTTPLDIKKLLGARMTGSGGQELGSIEQVFFDDESGVQEWARLRMGGMLGGKDRFVPLGGGAMSGKDMTVPYSKDKVVGSPELVVDRHISPEQEERLRAYYELGSSAHTTNTTSTTTTTTTASSKTASAAAAGVAGAAGAAGAAGMATGRAAETRQDMRRDGDLSLLRSEERIHFRTEDVETGRVRLHKYVDVVPVEERVRLMHEEFEIERVPVSEGRGDIHEDSVEIVLRGQQAFASKEVIPVERVRLKVRQVPEERVMRDEIRRERIEIERFESASGHGFATGQHAKGTDGNASGRAGDAAGSMTGKAGDMADKAGDAAGKAFGKVKGMFDGK
ncbi:YsnF/AvaK domain-containing protein [Actinocorallia longicatena]|uniref:DUF2382 domain-containing protein n=1 Tax=Actinocorallia longicatena TaxID=111803 RepID=A0ABP6QIJ0_9ACTN